MEETRKALRAVNAALLVVVMLWHCACNKCNRCEPIPSEVSQITGNWKWIHTDRVIDRPDGSYYTERLRDASVDLAYVINSDGCVMLKYEGEDLSGCIHNNHGASTFIDETPFYKCGEILTCEFEGEIGSFGRTLLVEGYDCNYLDTLHGLNVPYNLEYQLAPVPPITTGHTLYSYTNFFKRIR